MKPTQKGENVEAYTVVGYHGDTREQRIIVGEVGGQTTGRKIGEVIRELLGRRGETNRVEWGDGFAIVRCRWEDEYDETKTDQFTLHYPGGRRVLTSETVSIAPVECRQCYADTRADRVEDGLCRKCAKARRLVTKLEARAQ